MLTFTLLLLCHMTHFIFSCHTPPLPFPSPLMAPRRLSSSSVPQTPPSPSSQMFFNNTHWGTQLQPALKPPQDPPKQSPLGVWEEDEDDLHPKEEPLFYIPVNYLLLPLGRVVPALSLLYPTLSCFCHHLLPAASGISSSTLPAQNSLQFFTG